MVDILKLPVQTTASSSAVSYYSYVFSLQCKAAMQPMTGPVTVVNSSRFPARNYLSNLAGNRWIGRCPGDPPRLLDVAHAPYGIHRRIIYQELSRPVPGRTEISTNVHDKPTKNSRRDSLKTRHAPAGTLTSSEASFMSAQAQSTRLFDSLSKHITVKAEPLRPTNNFTTGTTSTLTSWQRYWASTLAERRR